MLVDVACHTNVCIIIIIVVVVAAAAAAIVTGIVNRHDYEQLVALSGLLRS